MYFTDRGLEELNQRRGEESINKPKKGFGLGNGGHQNRLVQIGRNDLRSVRQIDAFP